MKKFFLLVFCAFAFSTQSFAQDVTNNENKDKKISTLINNAVLSYYDRAAWTNSEVTYFAMNTSEWKGVVSGLAEKPVLPSQNSTGKRASCPDDKFSIIKILKID